MKIEDAFEYYKSKNGTYSFEEFQIFFPLFWNMLNDPFNELEDIPFILNNKKSVLLSHNRILKKVKDFKKNTSL